MKAQLQALTITVANQQKFPSKQGLPVNTNHQPNNNQLQKINNTTNVQQQKQEKSSPSSTVILQGRKFVTYLPKNVFSAFEISRITTFKLNVVEEMYKKGYVFIKDRNVFIKIN